MNLNLIILVIMEHMNYYIKMVMIKKLIYVFFFSMQLNVY